MLSPVKKRLVEYASSKGLKPYLLAEKSFIAKNTFANKSEISTENLIKVSTSFPDLNIDWVVTGRGEMIVKNGAENNEWREKYYETLEKYNACLEGKNATEPLGKTA